MLIICKPLNSVLILSYFPRHYFVSQVSNYYSSPMGFSPVTLKTIFTPRILQAAYVKGTAFCSLHSLISLSVRKDRNFPILCAHVGTQHDCLGYVFGLKPHLVYTVTSFIRYVHFFYFACFMMYFLRPMLTNIPSSSSLLHAVI
jgi:hypothetical protein